MVLSMFRESSIHVSSVCYHLYPNSPAVRYYETSISSATILECELGTVTNSQRQYEISFNKNIY